MAGETEVRTGRWQANAELIALVAKEFGCAKSAVTIKTGAGSKLKRVEIQD